VTTQPQPALDFAAALGWFVANRGKVLEVVLRTGGLTLEGLARYEDTTEEDGAFGVALCGLNWWLEEDKVTYVGIDPERDALFVQTEADDGIASMLLIPRSTF
jgi:hypothetical protein